MICRKQGEGGRRYDECSYPPTTGRIKREAALERNVESLVDAFRELHEVERMTGRTGVST